MAMQPGDMRTYLERQARFTKGVRQHAYRMIGLARCKAVVEVGSGTGAVAREIAEVVSGPVIALEKDLRLAGCGERDGGMSCVCGDALALPFKDASFDAALSHFFLMWMKNPAAALTEMKRVVNPGGWIVALAEPDYGGWIDYPEGLGIGEMLARSLIIEGADPNVGRKLRGIFAEAGLKAEVGLSNNIWNTEELQSEFEQEWDSRFKILGRSPALEKAKQDELKAIQRGRRLLFMPVFFAYARCKAGN
jgi:SAM-dependent methyltransferase